MELTYGIKTYTDREWYVFKPHTKATQASFLSCMHLFLLMCARLISPTLHNYSPISTRWGATLATAGDPGSPRALLSLNAALAAIPRQGLLVSRPALSRRPVSALISELNGMGRLISLFEMWRSGEVPLSPSVWMSFSLTDFFCSRVLISMMLPMISTGPVRVFLRGEKSSFTFFK